MVAEVGLGTNKAGLVIIANGGSPSYTGDYAIHSASTNTSLFSGPLEIAQTSANSYMGQGTGWLWSSNGTQAGTLRGGIYAQSSGNVYIFGGGSTANDQVVVSSPGAMSISSMARSSFPAS